MKLIEGEHAHTCTKWVKEQQWYGLTGNSYRCGQPAKYEEQGFYFCKHHSRMERYVVRDGRTGPVIARFNTKSGTISQCAFIPRQRLPKAIKKCTLRYFSTQNRN